MSFYTFKSIKDNMVPFTLYRISQITIVLGPYSRNLLPIYSRQQNTKIYYYNSWTSNLNKYWFHMPLSSVQIFATFELSYNNIFV